MLDTIIALTYAARLRALGVTINLKSLESYGFRYVPRYSAYQFNPTDDFMRKNGYFPNVAVQVFKSKYNGEFVVDRLKVQCSVQRMIFGTSFYLVDQTYLSPFSETLAEKLTRLGIGITPTAARKLSLSEFAPSWNSILPKHFGRPVGFLKRWPLLDIGKQFRKVLHTEYDEEVEGYCFREYSQNTGFRIYDNGSSIRNHPKTMVDAEVNVKTQNELLPTNILRIERTYQKKSAARDAISKFIPKGKNEDIYVEDVFHNNICQWALTDTINRIGNVFDLIVADLGYQPQFLPIEYVWQIAEHLGLSGHDKAYFSNYALAVAQIGRKNANVLYDDTFGREGQKNRSKYHSLINQKLGKVNLHGFFLCDLFEEIKTQINDFRPYRTDEEANKILAEAEERQERREAKANPVAISMQQPERQFQQSSPRKDLFTPVPATVTEQATLF